jgi:uncharacterized protein (DUF885 family)
MAWVDTVAEEYVERAAALDPVLATQAGIAGHDHELPDLSADGFAERARLDRLTLAALDAAEVRGPGEQVAREAMRERLGLAVECYDAGDTTSGGGVYYSPPSEDWSRPGRLWWSVPDGMDSFATWKEVTIVYHEGVPGHHLQFAQVRAQRETLNRWQRQLCWVSGHGEGWACYAEKLMDELGYLDTAAARRGMLDMQLMYAVNAVLDIGVHLELRIPEGTWGKGEGERWNRKLTWEFLQAHSSLEKERLRFTLHRYLGWPGQAPSYQLGGQIWLQARADAEQRAGDTFSLKEFHSKALSLGSMGLDPLRQALVRL